MNAYALAAIFATGGAVIGSVGLWLLYKAGYWGGAANERQKIEDASAGKMQRQNTVLQKEVTNADLRKSFEDGTF